ncbi:MAG: hypothetical protein D6785_11675 [Planctomycetota bacterium]|nr:MAG: hypothetical protein D6785_11675 [Planctomycetota bacterium]
MGKNLFFTGFPGFISERLVGKFLQETDHSFIFLVLPQMKEAAEKLLRRWDVDFQRAEIVVGDITKPHLGLSKKDFYSLAERIHQIFHLAALYHLGGKLFPSYLINVIGTRHILYLAQKASSLESFDYFSTAYVAGKRRGRVMEQELDKGQRWRNHYESTKFQAEVEVRRKMDSIPTRIYRPAIVVGDSKNGVTLKLDGPYYAIRLLSRLKKANRLYMAPYLLPPIGSGEADLNIVPVDFIANAVFHLSQDPKALGHTFHLVDPHPMKVKEFKARLFQAFQIEELPFALPKEVLYLFEWVPRKIWDKWIGMPLESLYYLNDTPTFDTTTAIQFLQKYGVQCPPVSSYLHHMIHFVEEGQAVPFVSTPMGLVPASSL